MPISSAKSSCCTSLLFLKFLILCEIFAVKFCDFIVVNVAKFLLDCPNGWRYVGIGGFALIKAQ